MTKTPGDITITGNSAFSSGTQIAQENPPPLAQLLSSRVRSAAKQKQQYSRLSVLVLAVALGFKNTESFDAALGEANDIDAFLQSRSINYEAAIQFTNLEGLPPSGDPDFDVAVKHVLKIEGGYSPNEPGGAIAMFGINSAAHPHIDVANLTIEQAIGIYKDEYWDPMVQAAQNLGLELDHNQMFVLFDASVNHGPAFAKRMLEETGGELTAMMAFRMEFYQHLATANPTKYGEYLSGWKNRLSHVSDVVTAQANQMLMSSITQSEIIVDPNTAGKLPFGVHASGDQTSTSVSTATTPRSGTGQFNEQTVTPA